jgi:hypothetical protein
MLATFTQDMVYSRGFRTLAVFDWSERVVFSEQTTDLIGHCTLASKHGRTHGFFSVSEAYFWCTMLDIYCLQKTNMYGSITKCGVQFRKSFSNTSKHK